MGTFGLSFKDPADKIGQKTTGKNWSFGLIINLSSFYWNEFSISILLKNYWNY